MEGHALWPALPLSEWEDTFATLHRYAQIVGKLKLGLAPMKNHWWQVALHVTPRGLTTGIIPYERGGFTVDFDFLAHELVVVTSTGERERIPLEPRPVAEFYGLLRHVLARLGIECRIWDVPVEIPNDTTRFHEDYVHRAYDPEYARRFAAVLLQSHLALDEFRARFRGKTSGVRFYWGSFDLAVARFSGRLAPPKPGADAVTQEAYCEEVASVGFWPGSPGITDAAYYAYASPEPPGFGAQAVFPDEAHYEARLAEYVLPYEAVRRAADPRAALIAFCQTTYDAAADLGGWDRERLEGWPMRPHKVRKYPAPEQPAAD